MNTIDNKQDIMDSRYVIALIEEMIEEQQDLIDAVAEQEANDDENDGTALEALADYWECTLEEARDGIESINDPADSFHGNEELHNLKKFAADLEGQGVWEHGETLIRDSYFSEYAEELANDMRALNEDDQARLPKRHIDWEA